LENAQVSQNAGSAVLVQTGGHATLTNTTIGGNTLDGVIVNGDASFVNSTIAFNGGAGIANQPGPAVRPTNTIVAGNTLKDCSDDVTASVASIDEDSSCGANVHADPRLGPLTNNGGPTLTRALEPGSPAIDTGDSSACPTLDQRFAPRVGTCDLGAFE